MQDKLLLANMLFYGYHGALPEETVLGQRFCVSLEIVCDTRPAAEVDDLALALNYATVCAAVKGIVEGPPCKLLETVAEKIAAKVLDMGAVSVLVTVKKLHPPVAVQMDYAAVQIERTREAKGINKKNRPLCSGARAYLSLGSNLGDREQALSLAVKSLARTAGITVLRVADILETEPVGYAAQGRFLNTAVEIETTLSPYALLNAVQQIEQAAGRVRTVRFGPRTLDIDILLYADICMAEADLVIPHPRMHEREFVLAPLAQIAPGVLVPPAGNTVRELYQQLLQRKQV